MTPSLPSSRYLRLELIDVLGRRVSTLVDGWAYPGILHFDVAVPHRYCVTMSPLYLPALRAHTSSSSSPLRRRIEALLTTTLQRSQ